MALLNRAKVECRMKNEASRMASRSIALGVLALVSSFFILHSSFAAESRPEPEVKAAFVVNFPKYVEWPAETTNAPIVIALLGGTKVNTKMQKIILK